jgi:hypothetical protein
MTKPTMRVTNIALDYEEMPREFTLIASAPVADRLGEFTGHGDGFAAGEPFNLAIHHAAQIAQHFGSTTPADDVTSEIWDCLVNVFNRFWDGGLEEYEAARVSTPASA